MFEALKDTVLVGLDAAVLTRDAVEKVLGKLVAEGTLTADEMRRVADHLHELGKQEWLNLQEHLAAALRNACGGLDFDALRGMGELRTRLEALERHQASLEARFEAMRSGLARHSPERPEDL